MPIVYFNNLHISINFRKNRPWVQSNYEFTTYLFDIADCDEPVLIHEAVETVERMLPDATVPRFSRSPVLRCFFSFNPWWHYRFIKKKQYNYSSLNYIPIIIPFSSFPPSYSAWLVVHLTLLLIQNRHELHPYGDFYVQRDQCCLHHYCVTRSSKFVSFWDDNVKPNRMVRMLEHHSRDVFPLAIDLDMILRQQKIMM